MVDFDVRVIMMMMTSANAYSACSVSGLYALAVTILTEWMRKQM